VWILGPFLFFSGIWGVSLLLHFAWVVDDAKCIVVTCVCLSVCLSAAACPHYCTDPDVTWGSSRGCPLVVHYWADLQHNVNPSYKLVSIPRYDNISRDGHKLVTRVHVMLQLHGRVCTHCWQVTGAFSKLCGVYAKWAWLAGRWRGAFSTLLRRCGLRASNGGILAK